MIDYLLSALSPPETLLVGAGVLFILGSHLVGLVRLGR